ncbi:MULTISPECIES: hypothetical protein [Mesorhizobium]|uniref:hypothetical protein n=1 Tax=Mesorhizobium TaxID=68287 RepID=UPI0007A954B9|nr:MULTISPECIES: hypothetical protein [Mesorhizobium]AMX93645.1 hypothetical protein A4R28_11310 [Mesorhizobium ciceri]MDF3208336.1 hypothetical protein [Mesorhizobium sp. LMG15046]MDF3229092.1 hypothetical protein [Mesorhizobium sp. DSM 30133]RUU22202.1 hypothetical protein EOC84_03580 [Mesorhizobium sp. Primo-B]RUU37888.1 hypothetical protein EOC83_16635 [Mesorhizobium sp. Primo-A]
MKVCFYRSSKPREGLLADAFARGVIEHGDEAVVRQLDGDVQVASDCEVAVMVGVKSKELYQANWRAGIHTILLDKGYSRHSAGGPIKTWEYWRVSVDGHHPTRYLMKTPRPADRLQRLRLKVKPWRTIGDHIVIAGSSAKYNAFYGLPEPTEYAESLVRHLRQFSDRPIVYRPKPSWKEAVAIDGARFSYGEGETIDQVLDGAHAVVTHGSNACFEAVLAGIPCVVLGDAVAKPISSVKLADIESPLMVKRRDRNQWLANLAYAQFTLPEYADGEAWQIIRPQIYG